MGVSATILTGFTLATCGFACAWTAETRALMLALASGQTRGGTNSLAPRRFEWNSAQANICKRRQVVKMAEFCGFQKVTRLAKPPIESSLSVMKPISCHQSHGGHGSHERPHVKAVAAVGGVAPRPAEASQGKTLIFPPVAAGFTSVRVRMTIGRPRPPPGYPTTPAYYPVSVRPLRVSSRASSPPHLAVTQLPPTNGSGHHGP